MVFFATAVVKFNALASKPQLQTLFHSRQEILGGLHGFWQQAQA
jgi:hypothetical protein